MRQEALSSVLVATCPNVLPILEMEKVGVCEVRGGDYLEGHVQEGEDRGEGAESCEGCLDKGLTKDPVLR